MTKVAILVLAGGSGTRFGSTIPKQYCQLGGKAVLRRSIEAFSAAPGMTRVVVARGFEHRYSEAIVRLELPAPISGGGTRQESVNRGLQAIKSSQPDVVLIHDAARPLVTRTLIDSVIGALEQGAEAVVPLLPVCDSLRRTEGGSVKEALSRDGICRAQTPQGFMYTKILDAHEHFAGADASDDITLAELAGMKITAVPGEEANIKITTASDLAFAERLIAGSGETRVGTGFDVHHFTAGDHIWLCGLRIPHDRGLEGHSDADAGLHALTDAILGALAAADIGQHFPPSDEHWRGASSRVFLQHAGGFVRERGGAILHCDITVICERPKIGPHREAMRASVAEILGLDISRISVKATTTEGLGFTGRGEGMAAQAAATIRLPA